MVGPTEGAANGHDHRSSAWSPSSWRSRPIKQPVAYEDEAAVAKSRSKLQRLPPIVTPYEIWKLRRSLADVAE
ncbi:hypothetical protein LTR95_008034, partial [Oleoguttula sp. CCFEE 5521]